MVSGSTQFKKRGGRLVTPFFMTMLREKGIGVTPRCPWLSLFTWDSVPTRQNTVIGTDRGLAEG